MSIPITRIPGETDADAMARSTLDPTSNALIALDRFSAIESNTENLLALAKGLREKVEGVSNGTTKDGVEMLVAQSVTLDLMFNRLAGSAMNGETLKQLEVYMKLALRAQSQARSTWEAVALLKNPPIAKYVGQANVSQGHQQVNNEPSARETKKVPNELLEKADGERLEFGTTEAAERANSAVETVGTIQGTSNP